MICGCSGVGEDISQASPTDEGTVLIRIPAFQSETIVNVTSIELFQFSDGSFVKKLTLDATQDQTVELAKLPRTRIFALAAHSLDGNARQSESEFSISTISMPEDSHSAPVFFSSVTEIHEGESSIDIELRRAVSRLDISNEDPDLKIGKVVLSGAASSSQIFPMDGRTCECACASYTRNYDDGIYGLEERAFILFETSTPVSVAVKGTRNGVPVEITVDTPVIERNNIYTVTITKNNSGSYKDRTFTDDDSEDDGTPKTTIRVNDWEEGDLKNADLDLQESAIDLGKSYLPSGVKVNASENTVTVPSDGVSGMRLAFATSQPLQLGSVISESDRVKVTPIEPKSTGDGYICEFLIDIDRQPKCAMRYQATVFFKGSSNFYINIEVDSSPYQIPTVRIGGHDWMCFNAVSQDPEEQIFLPKGMTVEKMYTDRFVDCVGNFFQYGRPHPFSPWKANDPNGFADQKRDTPWATQSMMPLPKGYHVASMKEWEDLIPNGTVIPSTYTTPSGEKIRATLYTFPGKLDGTPSATTNAMQYLKRCVILESLTTGAKLCLPMGGIKTNVSSEIPTQANFRFDTRSGYWMKEDRRVMMLQYELQGDGREGIQMERNCWNADGFVMIRGVRD